MRKLAALESAASRSHESFLRRRYGRIVGIGVGEAIAEAIADGIGIVTGEDIADGNGMGDAGANMGIVGIAEATGDIEGTGLG